MLVLSYIQNLGEKKCNFLVYFILAMDFLQQSSIPDYTTEKITASEWQLQLLKD